MLMILSSINSTQSLKNSMKSYAKVNITLKITAKRGDYHEIFSRFMKVQNLFDELTFVKKIASSKFDFEKHFSILGDFDCDVKDNTIYKAYKALLEHTNSKKLKEFFQTHSVKVEKNIPAFAGLGGGSSNAATFLKMCNNELNLKLTLDELSKIGASVGADVAFFIYDYASANVRGVGEIVEKFDEEPLEFDIFTPDVKISTPKVYQEFRKNFYKELSSAEEQKLSSMSSIEMLKSYTKSEANDLYAPAIKLYPELKNYEKDGYFFSGSGSSYFKVKVN